MERSGMRRIEDGQEPRSDVVRPAGSRRPQRPVDAPSGRAAPAGVICPKGKRGFSRSVAEAKLAAYAAGAEWNGRGRRPVRVYECPHCQHWHLTSAPLRA